MREKDVRLGRATIVVDGRGGWALPGGRRTDQRAEATRVAAEIDLMLSRIADATPAVEPEPVVTTRRAAKNATLIHSRT